MRLTAVPISPGSYAVRIWVSATPAEVWAGAPHDTICNVNRLSQYECEISPSSSLQDEETSRALCLKCFDLGFKIMHFSVSAGSEVTQMAEYVKTVNGLDFYTIDWISAAGA